MLFNEAIQFRGLLYYAIIIKFGLLSNNIIYSGYLFARIKHVL